MPRLSFRYQGSGVCSGDIDVTDQSQPTGEALRRIAYIVHDLNDPAVSRRVTTLGRAGITIDLFGFHRGVAPAKLPGVASLHPLGETFDGRFLQRSEAVAARWWKLGDWAAPVAGAQAIVARNLEMLLLADAARRRFAPHLPVYYELLDIHRLVARDSGVPAILLRRLEGALIARAAGIIISSPAFETEYLRRWYRRIPPILLVENKVMPGGLTPIDRPLPKKPGPPWRIGWFGAIRCRRSLLILADLARKHPGLIEVDIRGRVTGPVGADFADIVAATPGLTYHGPYRYPDDLPTIYAATHFSWAIDFYEEGLNSSWLLPNRLYEGGWCGAVPIAVDGVETGRWLARQGLGVRLEEPLAESLGRFLEGLSAGQYAGLVAAAGAADRGLFEWGREDFRRLAGFVGAVGGVP